MSNYRITSRYAKALLDLSIERNELQNVQGDVSLIVETLAGSRQLVVFLANPVVLPQKKLAVLTALFKERISKTTFKFIEVMVRKNRSALIYEILEAFLVQFKAHEHIADATLVTAVAAANRVKEEVIRMLESAISEKVVLTNVVNEAILGGFQIRYKDKLLDASVSSKLNILRKRLID
ncbi:MAG: ATP synthase F1 subunit delta [Bacteroidetes bacterium]|jgi:F-type H+-transporting ATPase subunit delta|nr:ATP synthase F1 subunit delta [Bacteroidota bacterium]